MPLILFTSLITYLNKTKKQNIIFKTKHINTMFKITYLFKIILTKVAFLRDFEIILMTKQIIPAMLFSNHQK